MKSRWPPLNRREGARVARCHEWIVLSHDEAKRVVGGFEEGGESARDVRGAVEAGERKTWLLESESDCDPRNLR